MVFGVKGHTPEELLGNFPLVLVCLLEEGLFAAAHIFHEFCHLVRKGVLQRLSGAYPEAHWGAGQPA